MARWGIAEWVGPTVNEGDGDGRPGEPEDLMYECRGLIVHIMQGSYGGSIAWGKNPDSDVSFHFANAKDGRLGQLVDTDVRAWTQGSGNGRWLSVENEGYSGEALTPAQVENVAQLYALGVQAYGWPLQATDSPDGAGLGWHGMGGAAWGGHPDCPGEPIKAQRSAILARAAEILGGSDMTAAASDVVERWSWGFPTRSDGSTPIAPVMWRINDEKWQADVTARLKAAEARDAAMVKAIEAITSNGGPDAAPIIAAINSVRDDVQADMAELLGELAEANAEIARLRAAIAAGERAQADALAQG